VNHPVLLLVSISTITHRLLLLSRGLYFAAESKYCHKFAFNPKDGLRRDMQSWSERPESLDGERELFLTKLLIGNEIHMSRCPTLRAPPMDPITRQKYNTVTGDTSYKSSNGETSRSQVWIVYENGRAYPEYLVRYYRGEQDLERTPFVTQKDAETSVFSQHKADSDIPMDVECGEQDTRFIWEFEGNYGWEPFDEYNQSKLESAFQRFDDPLNSNCRDFHLSSGRWVYNIDFETMKQVNINHSRQRVRDIRRREVDVELLIH
jgi:WWE domain